MAKLIVDGFAAMGISFIMICCDLIDDDRLWPDVVAFRTDL